LCYVGLVNRRFRRGPVGVQIQNSFLNVGFR